MRFLKKIDKLQRLLRNPHYRRALQKFRVAAAVEHESMLANYPIKTLIDVGANVGQFSLAAKVSNAFLAIHAFEPLPQPAKSFKALFCDDPQVELHEVALGEHSANTEMNVSNRVDSSSLLEISDAQLDAFPGTHAVGKQTVTVLPLAEVLAVESLTKPIMLKIDVQGFEDQVLKGCSNELAEMSYVYVEASFKELYTSQVLVTDILSMLFTYGFTLEGIYNSTQDHEGIPIQADFLFKKAQP